MICLPQHISTMNCAIASRNTASKQVDTWESTRQSQMWSRLYERSVTELRMKRTGISWLSGPSLAKEWWKSNSSTSCSTNLTTRVISTRPWISKMWLNNGLVRTRIAIVLLVLHAAGSATTNRYFVAFRDNSSASKHQSPKRISQVAWVRAWSSQKEWAFSGTIWWRQL